MIKILQRKIKERYKIPEELVERYIRIQFVTWLKLIVYALKQLNLGINGVII